MVRVTFSAAAVVLGLTLGLGAWILVSRLPSMSGPRLANRVAPHVLDISPEAREQVRPRSVDPIPVLGLVLSPGLARLRQGLSALLGGDRAAERRLRQAGSPLSVEGFRARQVLGVVAGIAGGIAAGLVGATVSDASPLLAPGLALLGGMLGIVIPDQLLARAARRRSARIASELPTVLEFVSLALSAGEGMLDALGRVARVSNGELARELGQVVATVNTGVPLSEALRRGAAGLAVPAVTRWVDHVLAALERGSPIVEVLRAQAQDARDDGKRQLLEAAGKKELAMLIPLVFLILPVTVLFAIFPATIVLQLGS